MSSVNSQVAVVSRLCMVTEKASPAVAEACNRAAQNGLGVARLTVQALDDEDDEPAGETLPLVDAQIQLYEESREDCERALRAA